MTIHRIKLTIMINLILFGFSLAQDFSVSIQYGLTSYNNLGSLREFQRMVKTTYEALDIPVKSVQSFPESPEMSFELLKLYHDHSIGFFYNQSASGGRYHYADYSGSVKLDYTLTNRRYGIVLKNPAMEFKAFRFFYSVQLGFMPTIFEFSESLVVWDNNQTEEIHLETIAYFSEPGFGFEIMNFGDYSIGGYVGYAITIISNPYHLPNNENATLEFDNGRKLQPDWTEVKVRLTLTYSKE